MKNNNREKIRCPMCKRFVAERNNEFSHHMGVNVSGINYGVSKKQICFASGYPINNSQAIINDYNHLYNSIKQLLAERKKA
jgi:hypothetical protein